MKKLLTLMLVCAVAATASAGLYNTELLADGSFETWEANNPHWVYYWNVHSGEGRYGVDTLSYDGDRSLQITSDFNPAWSGHGVTLNSQRNAINKDLTYQAGDVIQASLWVNVQNWDVDGDGKGIGFRILQNGLLATSDFVNDTAGDWQQLVLEYEYTEQRTGDLVFEIRFYHSDPGAYTNNNADLAYVDLASMVVVPEPMTIGLLGLGGLALIRKRK